MKRAALLGIALFATACRGEARPATEDAALARLVDSLIPQVEHATGLTFKRKPRAVIISREQARSYLVGQLQKQFPGERGRSLATSYRLLGLLPDTLDLQKLFLEILTEQVAGYYDPDSSAFFGVAGADPTTFRITVAHELVHALQHDYVPLDSILDARDDADRLAAAQAVLEGQATIAMFRIQPTIGDRVLEPSFWDDARESIRQQQGSMPQFAGAPRVIREGLLFPYIAGAEYMRWWITHRPRDQQPFGARMPRSSEQILAPDRAERGDVPLRVTFTGTGAARYGDVLGAAEVRVLLAEARGQAELVDPAVLGWGGDRFELYEAPGGEALVWIAVFDSPPARDAVLAALQRGWPPARSGYRTESAPLKISGRPGVRLAVAPMGWAGWSALPWGTVSPED
ncbi:MAG: hypothetical protein ABIQ41_03740 [Gemmatimonadales bacterium]